MARDYKREYQRRLELVRQRGYPSMRAYRNATSTRKRDYALERERANIRAQSRGFLNSSAQAKFNRLAKKDPALDKRQWQKQQALSHFGISEYRFNRMRKENRQYSDKYAQSSWAQINTYDIDVDRDVHNWSEHRVGYIIYFHAAIVDPATNYDSLVRKGQRLIDPKTGKRVTNEAQYMYLVKYSGIMSARQFDERYGRVRGA